MTGALFAGSGRTLGKPAGSRAFRRKLHEGQMRPGLAIRAQMRYSVHIKAKARRVRRGEAT